jgi:hypothetical protein
MHNAIHLRLISVDDKLKAGLWGPAVHLDWSHPTRRGSISRLRGHRLESTTVRSERQ